MVGKEIIHCMCALDTSLGFPYFAVRMLLARP